MTTIAVCVLLLLGLVAPTAAQTHRGCVEGGVLADYDPTLRADQATTAGVTGSVGVFITPGWSLRLEIDYPQWHETHRRRENRVAGHIEASDVQDDGRSPSTSVLVGRDYALESRVHFSWVAGVTVTRREFRMRGWTERLDLQGNVTNHTEIDRRSRGHTWWAGSAGADMRVPLTNPLALIAQIRVHTYGGLSEHTSQVFARPRVVLRWEF